MKERIELPKSKHLAAATLLAIVVCSVLPFLLHETEFARIFTVSWSDVFAKIALSIAMIIVIVAGRPRVTALRRTLGFLAAITLAYGAFGAFTHQLALGNMVIFFFGAFIATMESLEAKIPSDELDIVTVLRRNRA